MFNAKGEANMMTKQEIAMTWNRPRSVCACGHSGDGPLSEHLESGHGACKVQGCDCQKFTWARFMSDFEAAIQHAPRR